MSQKLDSAGGQISGNLTISGDLNIVGSVNQAVINNSAVSDNTITLNSGEEGEGVTAGTAAVVIDRGTEDPYYFEFDESDDLFKVGKEGELETVATRDWSEQYTQGYTYSKSQIDSKIDEKTSEESIAENFYNKDEVDDLLTQKVSNTDLALYTTAADFSANINEINSSKANINSPSFEGEVTIEDLVVQTNATVNNLTVIGGFNIPGGMIWIGL